MDFSKVDWAVVAATIIGPISAVVITLWYQKRERIQRERMNLFSAMMRSRHQPLSSDYVSSLNMIPAMFSSKREVMKIYSTLMEIYNDVNWINRSPDLNRILADKRNTAAAYLLHAIGQSLGVYIDQIQILKHYSPQNWDDKEQFEREMKLALFDTLNGKRPLPVVIVSQPKIEPQSSE